MSRAIARLIPPLLAAVEPQARRRLSILIFHRVHRSPDPLFPGEADAARVDWILGLVRRAFRVLPLREAVRLREEGCLPPAALSITFDDSYADNAEVALPLLQRHGLTATFFIASGVLDGGRMFNDSVIECIRRSRLDHIDLGDLGLGRLSLSSNAERRAAIDALLPRVKYLDLAAREAFLRQLQAMAGHPALPDNLMMLSSQVVELSRAGMDIGGHTVNHPILRLLPDDEAEAEIRDGRDRLQTLTDSVVDTFAYPNGRPGQDYDQRHVDMVRRLGFRAAVSTVPGVAGVTADRFQLPRFTPWDSSPARWLARLTCHRMASRPTVGV